MNMSKQSGNDKAIATWGDDVTAAGMIGKVTPDDLKRYAERGAKFERAIKLAEGDKVEGIYLGQGAPREFEDKATGEVRTVATHRFEVASGQVALITGSTQLDRQLSTIPEGTRAVVIRGAQVELRGGHRMTEYLVSTLTG
jgi:hypothetical protein